MLADWDVAAAARSAAPLNSGKFAMENNSQLQRVMRASPVIAVIVVDRIADAKPMAEALVAEGVFSLEVTLRTQCALEAIAEMKSVEGAIVGAGTVINSGQFKMVTDAGAEFVVSPGLTESLAKDAIASGIPYLPGIANSGDIMRGLDLGLDHFKFFPAETSGGLRALKSLAAPFGQCKFCPTGGITMANAKEWLSFEPVLCVGGSWLTAGTLEDIRATAKATIAALR